MSKKNEIGITDNVRHRRAAAAQIRWAFPACAIKACPEGVSAPSSRRCGFTLIELMIVLAIIGVLAAIAIPVYSAFVARAQFSEAITLAGGLKTAVGEEYGARNTLVGVNNGVGAIPAASGVSGQYVSGVDVKNGVITSHFSDDSLLAGAVAVLQPKPSGGGSLTWSCRTTASPSKTPGTCESVGDIIPVDPSSSDK